MGLNKKSSLSSYNHWLKYTIINLLENLNLIYQIKNKEISNLIIIQLAFNTK